MVLLLTQPAKYTWAMMIYLSDVNELITFYSRYETQSQNVMMKTKSSIILLSKHRQFIYSLSP